MPDSAQNATFPVPISRFLATLKGTSDEIWTKLLKDNFGTEKHTMVEWGAVLATVKKWRA
jgi:hypothetical protein